MALNVGQDFKKRWLDAPEAVRQTYLDDLNRICDLLTPESNLQAWLDNDKRAMQVAQLKVEQAYADLKAQLIEEARVRKQLALEKSLAEKRALQQQYNQQLIDDEIRQFQQQTVSLAAMREDIQSEIIEYTARYTENPSTPAPDYANNHFKVADHQIMSELESVRLRLELEAETFIEHAVQDFRVKLKAASDEEIKYILKNSKFSDTSE
ncbi:hypothetical protein A7P53_05325 [Acinetobacter defluvii]|nr:hypothetical protein [Acinetobacter defluvii]